MTEEQISTMKETANYYHNLGLNIIPFFVNPTPLPSSAIREKKPTLLEYKQWNERAQTEEEYSNLDWNGANGFGLILGQKTKDGRYLGAIDFDPKLKSTKKYKIPGSNKYVDVSLTREDEQNHNLKVELAEKILKEFPTTKIEKTVNFGRHLFYWSKAQPEIDGTFHDETLIELLGNKKLCVMYPSYGYQNVGSDIITEVEDLGALFHDTLKKHGFIKNEKTEIENQQDNYSFKIEKLIDLTKLTDKGNGQYQGSHPIHDSTTEANFAVDIIHNQWHCFRCNSGGGALQYLAMKEGLIKCEQAKRGALRGKKFQETLQLAVAQGLIDEKVLDQAEINPVILAKDIMEDNIFVVDKETDELFYYVKDGKDEGIYSNQTEQLIRREITNRLDENFKARYKTEVTEFILGTAPLVQMGNQNPELIAVQNGMLNVIKREIEKYDSQHYITNKLPVIFNKDVNSHVWKDFTEKIVTIEKQRRQLQQLIGHTLYGKILVEICTVLLGGGSNGKTILLQTLTKFLGGSKNVSSHSIQALCYDKFVTGEVRGKLANICADLPHKELANTANFKALTSGDSMEAYIKHVQKTVSFLPTTKYIFSANQIPPVANEEDCFAWYRRFVIVDFLVTFTPENSTPRQELLASLSTPECYSEILNWALEGLDYIREHGDISDRPTVDEIRLIYIKNSDSALAYFAEKVQCTSDENDIIFLEDFHRDYVNYCLVNSKKPKTEGDFTNTIKNHLPGAEKCRVRPEYTYVKGEPRPNARSAYRYIKVVVSTVSVVQGFKNIRAKTEKNNLLNFIDSNGIVSKPRTIDTTNTTKDTTMTFRRLGTHERQNCRICKVQELELAADYAQILSEADAKELNCTEVYYCEQHFTEGTQKAQENGVTIDLKPTTPEQEIEDTDDEEEEVDDRNYDNEGE
jgi:P4 family phage/plasmid primase-like protien